MKRVSTLTPVSYTHLDGEQAVHAAHHAGRHRHADNGERGVSRQYTAEMCGLACCRDDNAEAFGCRVLRQLLGNCRGAVRCV